RGSIHCAESTPPWFAEARHRPEQASPKSPRKGRKTPPNNPHLYLFGARSRGTLERIACLETRACQGEWRRREPFFCHFARSRGGGRMGPTVWQGGGFFWEASPMALVAGVSH